MRTTHVYPIPFLKLPCRKGKSRKRGNTEKQLYAVPEITGDEQSKTATEDVFSGIPDLQAISPAPSFKSIDIFGSSPYLNNSIASMYWSYPSLASRSYGPSLATSTASFKTALEQIGDADEDVDKDDNLSFSSIPTSKRDLNSSTGTNCDINSTESNGRPMAGNIPDNSTPLNPTTRRTIKEEPVWVKKPELRKLTQIKNSAQIASILEPGRPAQYAVKEMKQNGTPIGIKRFKNGPKSVIIGDDRVKRANKNVANDNSTKDTLNNSF